MKKIMLVLAFLPIMITAQNPKNKPFKNATYTISFYSSNENLVKQTAIQVGMLVPLKKGNQTIQFTVTGSRTREQNKLANNDIGLLINLFGKSKR